METKKLYRSRDDKMIAGVCGGLGKYLHIDPTLLRLIFALLVVFGIGSGLLVYLILMIVVPLEPVVSAAAVSERVEVAAPDAAPVVEE
ncbi:MAG: hypothetical protein AUK03_08760 [Anaerolineae bacterium CG2_30_64_16]|nr:MAG: hypothetical protein AUK03_08760 [Anaerolineae bacterium CG2_30_64_16]